MAHRRATIDEIAAKAGVSITTVSNVMNSKGRFSETVRSRVLSAATELRFTPNALIRSIQTRRTNVIGVRTWPTFAGLLDTTISMYLQQGIVDGLGAAGYDLMTFLDLPERFDINQATRFLDGRVDGVILGPGSLPPEELDILSESRLPTVVLYHPNPPGNMGSVTIDNKNGMKMAIRHLVDLGHRRIAGYFPGASYDMQERRDGFTAGLAACGIPLTPLCRFDAFDYLTPADTFTDWLLALPDRPTAVVFGDDHIAFEGIAALEKRGLRIPADISIVGLDDTPRARHGAGLTTIRQPAREVGHHAAQMVIQLIQGKSAEDCHLQMPLELKIRSTTAPPPVSI